MARFTTIITPSWTPSMPMLDASGRKMGVTSSTAAGRSRNMPRKIRIRFIARMISQGSLRYWVIQPVTAWGICSKVLSYVKKLDYVPEEFTGMESMLSDTYFCNYSIFQSMPDAWAIDHLFPIMPIHRLNEEPTCRGILADITCDSDGKVDRFIDKRDVKTVLELHPYEHGKEYYLAAFLVGAYQEILGDLHNLLGDTNAVHVTIDEQGRAEVDEVIEGDTVREVLHYVQFNADELMRTMRKSVERALRDSKLTLDESRVLLKFYENGLEGYTYLE